MSDKSYWKQFSSIEFGDYTIYINSGNEDWAVFKSGEFVCDQTDLINSMGEHEHHMGMLETMLSCFIPPKVIKELIVGYIEFLYE